jgi:DNA-binding NtrC family response regulator
VSAGGRRLSRQVKHLILLEDDRDVAAMLTRLLGEEGYYVTCATRTADACEVIERVTADLLIADVLSRMALASPPWTSPIEKACPTSS